LPFLTPHDSVKFVVANEDDFLYARAAMAQCEIRAEIIITPVEGSDYRAIADYIVKENLPVRFQVQLHKILGMK
jgi:7-carboxy-7-deazaguanine synthase